jgi:hypothetical protein
VIDRIGLGLGGSFIQTEMKQVDEGKNMNKAPSKFQEKVQIDMTFEQYFRDRCHEMVCWPKSWSGS